MPLTALSDPNDPNQQPPAPQNMQNTGGPISRVGPSANAPSSAPPTSAGFAPQTGYSSVGGAARQQLGQQSNPTGAPWQNAQRDQGGQATPWQQPASWQQQPQQGQPPQQPQQQQGQGPSQQSIAQQGLSGGAATTQNFLAALRQVGAGSNNAAMASPDPVQTQGRSMLGAPVAMGGNGGQVSYNNGLGAGGGNVSFGGQAPGLSTGGGTFANPNREGIQSTQQPRPQGGGAYGGATGLTPGAPSLPPGGFAQGAAGFTPPTGFDPSSVPRTGPTVLHGGPAVGNPSNPYAPGQTPPDPDLTRDGGYGSLPQFQALSGAQSSASMPGGFGLPTPPPGPTSAAMGGGVLAPPTASANASSSYSFGLPPPAAAAGPQVAPPPPLGGPQQATANAMPDWMSLSDERAKRDVAPAKKQIGSFLDALGAHEYSYKNQEHGKGRFVSPMAQEIERTSIGKSAIVEGADGLKRVDYARLAGAQLAASALFHRRLKALEARR